MGGEPQEFSTVQTVDLKCSRLVLSGDDSGWNRGRRQDGPLPRPYGRGLRGGFVKGAQRLAKEKYALRVAASPRRGGAFSLVNTGTGLVTDVPTEDIRRLIVDVVGAEKFGADEEVPEGATEFYLAERLPE